MTVLVPETKLPAIPTEKLTLPTTPLLPSLSEQADQETVRSTELYGYTMMTLSTVGFSGMAFFTHIAEHVYNFQPLPAVFIRSTIHTVLGLLYISRFLDIREAVRRLTHGQRKLLLARGVVGSIGMLCVFIALQKLPVGDAISIFSCSPVISMFMSAAMLGETITASDGIAAVISFWGILLIAKPGFNDGDAIISTTDKIVGATVAIAGACSSSAAYVIIRRLSTSIHFIMSMLSLSVVSIILSASMGGFVGPAAFLANKEGSMYILASSLFAFAGQACLNNGLQYCRAGPGLLIRNLDVPVAYFLGLLFLGEAPSWLSFAGALLVVTAAIMIGLRELMRS